MVGSLTSSTGQGMTNTTLVSDEQWPQIRRKAGSPQFAAAMELLRHEVEDFFARPVGVQALPGGYYHDYFCPQHAVQLIFEPDSPTLHRCPVDGATFSGEPFDSAWRWSVNNRLAESALRLAVLWKLEGEERNRQSVQEILLGYAEAYDGYKAYSGWRPENHGVAQFSTLDEAVWSIPLAWSFDLIRSTLSDAQEREIVDRLLHPAADFLMERHFGGIHNFACWHNAAIGTIGAVTGRDELLDFAIDGQYGFHTQAREGILADGLWFEGSFSYHFYTVAALLLLAKATANLPVWDLRRHPSLAAVLRAPVLCAYPDGSLPATNDCWYFTGLNDDCCHGVPKAPAFYEIGNAWFDEPLFGQVLARAYRHGPRESLDALLYGVAELESGPKEGLALPSVQMPASGYAILRTQPEEETLRSETTEQYVFLKYGVHGGGHGHPDKLGLSVYAWGERQSPDLGTPGYGIDLFQGWYRQTVSHNTVVLDGKSQPAGVGRSIAFRDDGPFQIADVAIRWGEDTVTGIDAPTYGIDEEAPEVYEGAGMRRAILVRGSYIVDIFLVDAGKERRIDWIFRNRGALAPLGDGVPLVPAVLKGDGYEYLGDSSSRPADGSIALDWQLGETGVKLFMGETGGTTLYAGPAPGNPAEDLQDLLIRQRTGSRTAFLSVLHPYKDRPRFGSVKWHGCDLIGEGWAACTVEGGKSKELWVVRSRSDVEVPPWLGDLPASSRFEYSLED
jgi:hypothetical protein